MAHVNQNELDRILSNIDDSVYGEGSKDSKPAPQEPAEGSAKDPQRPIEVPEASVRSARERMQHPSEGAARPSSDFSNQGDSAETDETTVLSQVSSWDERFAPAGTASEPPSPKPEEGHLAPSRGAAGVPSGQSAPSPVSTEPSGGMNFINDYDSQLESGDSMADHFAAPQQVASQQTKRPKNKKHHKAGIAVGAVVAGLAVVYVGGSLYFGSHFLPNTTIGSYDASNLTVDELAQHVTTAAQNYQAHVSGDGLDFTINGADIDYASDGTAFAQSAKSQYNAWEWPALILQAHSYNASEGVTYDADKLGQIVSNALDEFNSTATDPQNATLQYDASTQQFSVKPEVAGTTLNKDAATQTIEDGVNNANADITLDESELNKPAVTSDNANLQKSLTEANQLLGSDLTLTYNGSTIATVPSSKFAQWLTVTDDGDISADFETVKTWAQGEFSKQYDTVGTTRTYTRPDGKQVTVSGGSYGWNINGEELANNIVAAIQQDATTVEVPMKSTAANWIQGGQDWGTRYIDADLSEQHARMYDESGNIIWESDFVSGDTSEGHGTPEGVYAVNGNKGTNQTLLGLDYNHDGNPDYTSKVTYWIPFEENLVAFHDASWRSSFGGTIYVNNGSHGCLNLPSSAAKSLYDLTQVGDVVVVHS